LLAREKELSLRSSSYIIPRAPQRKNEITPRISSHFSFFPGEKYREKNLKSLPMALGGVFARQAQCAAGRK
jgi:hypothetical protein